MNYGFNLYGFNPDFINASNAARQRNAQEEALKQQQMNQMYNIWGQYGQQRNANIEAQKQRQFQAVQNELNRESQQEYNTMWRNIEEAKQFKKEIADDRKRALEILNKGEGATSIEKLELEDLINKYENDELGIKDLQNRAANQAADDLAYEKYLGEMPRGEATNEEWNNWLQTGQGKYANDTVKLLGIQKAFNSRGQTTEEEKNEYDKGQARKTTEETKADWKAKQDRKKELQTQINVLKAQKQGTKFVKTQKAIQQEIDKLEAEKNSI